MNRPAPRRLAQIDMATAADIPALCGLLMLLFAQEAEFTPDPVAQARGLALIVGNPQAGVILVAKVNGETVAMVNVLFTISTALGEPVALLEDMVVAPPWRSAGIGSQLLARAIALARDKGCRRITLLTDRTNESAQRFYARQGFAASSMTAMRLAL